MNHREMTAHVRNRLKHEGIAASVRLSKACRVQWIVVAVAEHGKSFTCEQSRTIARIASVNGLTYAQGMRVDDSAEYWALRPQGMPQLTFVLP